MATLHYSWDLGGAINGVRFSQVYGTSGTVHFETNGLLAIVTGRRQADLAARVDAIWPATAR